MKNNIRELKKALKLLNKALALYEKNGHSATCYFIEKRIKYEAELLEWIKEDS